MRQLRPDRRQFCRQLTGLAATGIFSLRRAATQGRSSTEVEDLSSDVEVICPMPRGKHHFFGYYDKFPWDRAGRYLLTLETDFIDRPPTPEDAAVVGMVDLQDGNRWIPLDETHAWYWQQGTMLQWLETAPDRLIIYNARKDGRFISVVRDVLSGETRELPRPVYAVSRDGKRAVSVNFSRVHRHRPGYGYVGVPDPWEDDPAPAEDGIYLMDLDTGDSRLIVSLEQIVGIEHEPSMDGASHWFNHLQFNHDNSRFIFLHRWVGEKPPWKTRLYTAAPDGSDICLVNSHDMTSHFDWKSPTEILAWARRHDIGDRYFIFGDCSDDIEVLGEGILTTDGHCSYSPDGRWILTDTYPDREEHKRTLILYRPEDSRRVDIGRFYAPPELPGEIRCDLHPRWSRDGTQVCFDSAHEGDRQVYVIDVSGITRGDR